MHVPPTDPANAERVGGLTRAAGLDVISYGSYFRAGYSAAASFDAELRAAKSLGARNIRIWAGKKGSAAEENRAAVVDSIRMAADASARVNATLSLEFHPGTLTDSYESALRLIDDADAESAALLAADQFRDDDYKPGGSARGLRLSVELHRVHVEGRTKFPLDHRRELGAHISTRAVCGRRSRSAAGICLHGSEGQLLRERKRARSASINKTAGSGVESAVFISEPCSRRTEAARISVGRIPRRRPSRESAPPSMKITREATSARSPSHGDDRQVMPIEAKLAHDLQHSPTISGSSATSLRRTAHIGTMHSARTIATAASDRRKAGTDGLRAIVHPTRPSSSCP